MIEWNGPVPYGWDEVELGKVCDVVAGPSVSLIRTVEYGAPITVVTPKNLEHGRITAGNEIQVAQDAPPRLDRYRLAPGDLVCVRTGDLGKQAIVGPQQDGWIVGNACFKLHPAIDSRYLLHYLGHAAVRAWISRHSSTTTVPTTTLSTLRKLPVLVPPRETQERIGAIMGSLDEKVALHREIVTVSEQLRDSLFPLLLESPSSLRGYGDS